MCFAVFYSRTPVPFEIRDQTVKFSPSDGEADDEMNPKAFSKDSQGREESFIYGGQSVRERFLEDFEEIDWLMDDVDDDAINDKTFALKNKINVDFQSFLDTELGPNRAHLKDEINFRFSQKAVTTVVEKFNRATEQQFQKIFTGRHPVTSKITLQIPKEETGEPVQIVATVQTVFDQTMSQLGVVQLKKPMQFSAQAIYLIPQNGKTEATVNFSFLQLPKR